MLQVVVGRGTKLPSRGKRRRHACLLIPCSLSDAADCDTMLTQYGHLLPPGVLECESRTLELVLQNKIRMELFRELLQVSPCCGDGGRVTSNMVLTRNPVGSGAQCVLVRRSFLNHPDQSRSENSPCQFIVNPWRNPTSQGSGVSWHVRIFNLLEGKPQMTDLHGLHETNIFIIPSKISIFATNEKWIKRKSGYATCATSSIQ